MRRNSSQYTDVMNRNALHLPPFFILLFLSFTPPFFYLLASSFFSFSFLFPLFFFLLSSSFLPLLHLLLLSHHKNEYLGLSSRDFLSSYPSFDQCQVPILILSSSFSFLIFPSYPSSFLFLLLMKHIPHLRTSPTTERFFAKTSQEWSVF